MKGDGKRLSPAALRAREDARRAALSMVAPVHVLNAWHARPERPVKRLAMSPGAARGLLAALADRMRHEHYLRVWEDLDSIQARAKE